MRRMRTFAFTLCQLYIILYIILYVCLLCEKERLAVTDVIELVLAKYLSFFFF